MHVACITAFISFPPLTLLWPAWRAYDGFYLGACLFVMVHWISLDGECILSVMEKHALYEGYRVGSHPMHHWFFDVMSRAGATAWTVVMYCALLTGIVSVIWRNVVDENVSHLQC